MAHAKLFGWMGLMVGLSYLTLCAVAPSRLLVEVDVPLRASELDKGVPVDAARARIVQSLLTGASDSQWTRPLSGGAWTLSEDHGGDSIHWDYVSDHVSLRLEFGAEYAGDEPSKKLQLISTHWPFAWRGVAVLNGARGQAEALLAIAADRLSASE